MKKSKMKKSKGVKVDFNVKEGGIEVLGNEIEKKVFSKISKRLGMEKEIEEVVKKLATNNVRFEGEVNLDYARAGCFANYALREAKHFSNVEYFEKDGMTEEKIKIKFEEVKSDFFDKTKSKEIDDWRRLWLDISNIMKLEETLESYKEIQKCYFKSAKEAWEKVELYQKYDEKFSVSFHYSKEKLQAMADVIENDFSSIAQDIIYNREDFAFIYKISNIVIENEQGNKTLKKEEVVELLKNCSRLRI